MINQISDYFYSYKNKVMEASDILEQCKEPLEEFTKLLKEQELDKKYQENFLTILGYTYRLEDINQRLFFTFQEAVYAIDLDKLMRKEDSLTLNSIVYALVMNFMINEYNGILDEETKQKAIETYKEIENRRAGEDNKYHKYQY